MKEDFDRRMKAREPKIQIGARVLLKTEQKRKSDPIWDPVPFRVVSVKGTLVTAQKDNRQVTRNVSFFKPFFSYADQTVYDAYESGLEPTQTRSQVQDLQQMAQTEIPRPETSLPPLSQQDNPAQQQSP